MAVPPYVADIVSVLVVSRRNSHIRSANTSAVHAGASLYDAPAVRPRRDASGDDGVRCSAGTGDGSKYAPPRTTSLSFAHSPPARTVTVSCQPFSWTASGVEAFVKWTVVRRLTLQFAHSR